MMSTPLKVWWHELNTWEPEQARHFYNVTLGWDFQPTALPDGNRYWVAHKEGRAVGGIFQLTQPDFEGIPSHWMTYLAVDDIVAAQTRAEQAGGEILRPAFRLAGVGKLSVVTDPTGAIIGLIEPEGQEAVSRAPVH
ncbi:VOC family protein [Aestuariivirga sp.]|uniref:VOC family protein n=1 Tax=Aestuariivirga sp. TaxID=2650926 RepID=UPI0035931287